MNARDECECCGDPGKYVPQLRRVLCRDCARELLAGQLPKEHEAELAAGRGLEARQPTDLLDD